MHTTKPTVIYWRRTDMEGLERLELERDHDGIRVVSTLICMEAGGFLIDHSWRLDREWRTRHVTVEPRDAHGHCSLHLERSGAGWLVDGKARPDLDGAEEPDLSVTPFCNTLAICRLPTKSDKVSHSTRRSSMAST